MIRFFDVFVPAPTVLTTFGRQKTRKTQKCETEVKGRQPVRFHAWYDNGNLGHPKTLILSIFSTYLLPGKPSSFIIIIMAGQNRTTTRPGGMREAIKSMSNSDFHRGPPRGPEGSCAPSTSWF